MRVLFCGTTLSPGRYIYFEPNYGIVTGAVDSNKVTVPNAGVVLISNDDYATISFGDSNLGALIIKSDGSATNISETGIISNDTALILIQYLSYGSSKTITLTK